MHFEQSYYVSVIKKHFPQSFVDAAVLEVGSYDVNGTIREFFENCEYTGLDLMPGPGVDVVSSGHEYKTYKRFDTVVSCECFEHNPYYFETFENMVSSTCGGGLVVFSCATEGRPEHGTSRTSPHDSPGTVSSGWEYYKNLIAEDFARFDFRKNFAGYRFMVNPGSQDLYFIGVKYPAPQDFEARLGSITCEVDKLVDVSVKLATFDALVQAGQTAEAEDFLNGIVSALNPILAAQALYKYVWLLISAKRYEAAEASIRRILVLSNQWELGARAEYLFQHSQLLHETGRGNEAITAARAAVKKAPFYADYREHLARLLLNAGDVHGAEDAVLEASKLSAKNASLQCRLNEIYARKKLAAGGDATTSYEVSFPSFGNVALDQAIRLWNLDAPVAGNLAPGGAFTISGWVLPRDEQHAVSLLIRLGPTVEVHELNVARPDVVSAILQQAPEETEQTQCGFSVALPLHEGLFRLGFRVNGKDYWAKEMRVARQPQILPGRVQWEFSAVPGSGSWMNTTSRQHHPKRSCASRWLK